MKFKIIFFCLFVPLFVCAQSLNELVKEGLRNNYLLKSGSSKINRSLKEEDATDNYPAPSVKFEVSQIPLSSFDLINSPVSQSISLSQMFPIGGKPEKMRNMKSAETNLLKADLRMEQNKIAMEISSNYYQLWNINKSIVQKEKYISILTSLGELYKSRAGLPEDSPLNLLMLENELNVYQNTIKLLEAEKYRFSISINRLLGRTIESPQVSPQENTDGPVDEVGTTDSISVLISSNPEISKSHRMREMLEAEIKANNAELIPDLMLEGMIMRMPQGMLVTEKALSGQQHGITMWKPEVMYSVMASITLPFAPWSIGTITQKEEALAAGLSSVDYETAEMRRSIETEIKTLEEKIKSYKAIVKNYENSVIPSAESVIEARKKTLLTDRNAVYNILNELKMLNMAETDYYMYKSELMMNRAELDIMLGKYLNNGE